MSTIYEQFKSVDRSTVTRSILGAVALVGVFGLVSAVAFLYAALMMTTTEVLANAGVLESFTPVEIRGYELLFEIPVVAAIGGAATRVVNIVSEHSYSLKTGVTVVAGGWLLVGGIHLWLIDFGVL
ncbi:MAG: hypothetical protein ACLFR6_06600 [Salinarchaeum sp.]